ncbi:MAG: glycosyl hydrolase [Halioglobus sp.]|nr:glycosyl hydrolase [Halioglobus sp.]
MAELRGAASVANVYGRDLVAAELFTSALAPWAHSPRMLQPVADLAFALGVNRPMIHTSVHQPFAERAPGLSLSIFGQYFTRHETWSELAGPWMDYLARSAWLLQQGRAVADIAYFYGEEAPLTSLFAVSAATSLPAGYGFDFVNADMLLNDFSVDGGALRAPSGASYKILFLGGSSRRMTVPVLRKLERFIAGGVTVVGDRPLDSPSLADDAGEFGQPRGDSCGGSAAKEPLRGRTPARPPRVWPTSRLRGATVAHARDSDAGVRARRRQARAAICCSSAAGRATPTCYCCRATAPAVRDIEAVFRVDGMQPELWDARTGDVEPVSWRGLDGRTVVDLRLEPLRVGLRRSRSQPHRR